MEAGAIMFLCPTMGAMEGRMLEGFMAAGAWDEFTRWQRLRAVMQPGGGCAG